MRNLVKCLELLVGENNVKCKVNLKSYLTFKVDCIAKILVEVDNRKSLIKVLDYLNINKCKYYIIGGGSNVIFSRAFVKDVVIHIASGYEKFYFKNGRYYLSTFSGNKVGDIIKKCKVKGFSCIEWAVGIPASIGGAIIMNMGAFDESISKRVVSVTYYKNGEVKTIKSDNKNNLFYYRGSVFKDENCVIISATLSVTKINKDELQKDIAKFLKMKSSTQPLNLPSCGSVFKNGDDYKVAKLIHDCNLKGCTIGGAQVSIKHSNFIVNFNNATGKDVVTLIDIIKREVYKKYNVVLKEEIIILDGKNT